MGEMMLDERSVQVLKAVIQSYIESPEPVGSRYVTKRYSLGCSSATIRNVMADLEELGFLSQPHTSSGRVPTDKGYRYYVEHIVSDNIRYNKSLDDLLLRREKEVFENVDAILDMTTATLSRLSRYMSLAVSPGAGESTFGRIDLMLYRNGRIAVILLTDEGVIKHKIIKNEFSFSQADLNRIARYFNKEFSGYTIKEIREHLVKEMLKEKERFDTLIARALDIYREVLYGYDADVFITGLTRMLDLPEFKDIEKIRDISKAIEDKHVIIKLIDRIMETGGVRMLIGSENPVKEMHGMSVIATAYREGGRPSGVIGIIGPTRMDYLNSISMVETAARFLTTIFEEGGRVWRRER